MHGKANPLCKALKTDPSRPFPGYSNHPHPRQGAKAPRKRGQAFIWAANLFHGGSPVTDPTKTRLSQVRHYYFRGCSYFTRLASDENQGKTFWRGAYDFLASRFVRNAGPSQRPS